MGLLPLVASLACTDPGDSGADTPHVACTVADVDPTAMLEDAIDGVATECEREALADFVATRSTAHGPWDEDIRMASSPDAATFTAIDGTVLESAAVPDVVIGPDGRYYLYFVDGRFDQLLSVADAGSTWMQSHGIPGLGALGLAVSDDGLTFTRVDDFAVDGIVRGMVVDPDVVAQPDGTWRMYYVGMTVQTYIETATWVYPEAHEVFWASSADLVHWHQEGSVAVGPFADPSVLCFPDDHCVMASFGLQWGRSTDGGRTFGETAPWGVDGFAPEFVQFEDGSARLFFNAAAVGAPIMSFYAADGETWVMEEGERMPDTYGEAVTLARARPEGWYMWFHTFHDLDDLPF